MFNIPYGETNFRKLRLENNLYVDKTSFQRISEFARDKRKKGFTGLCSDWKQRWGTNIWVYPLRKM